MKNKWFAYIHIDLENKNVVTSGISFNEFYSGIERKPENLLILKGYPDHSNYSKKLGFDYIPSENMLAFSKSDIYSFGDFVWVDFEKEEDLSRIKNDTLAELLYLAHTAKPLNSFMFPELNNQYAYYSHDDDWYVRVYMEHLKDYKTVVEYKILKELKGRKRSISPVPDDIMEKLFNMFIDGAVIDFEQSYLTGVRIYPMNMSEISGIDGIHRQLDKLRKSRKDLCLDYDINTKKWCAY